MKIPQSKGSNVIPMQLPARPDEKFLLMAAAKMHQEGRLVQPGTGTGADLGIPAADMPK